ncbi:MAG: ABC transporter permease [Candidatus Humimicrobiaceae bacterium]
MRFLKGITKQREFVIFIIVVIVFTIMSFASPVFLSGRNLLALLLSLSIESVIAVGMVMLFVSGGFDLSVGSVLGFTGVIVAMLLKAGIPTYLAMLIALLAGGVVGLWNGFVVAKLKINAFVTTLASLSIIRGLTFILTKGRNIAVLPDSFKAVGQARIGDMVQLPIIYALIFVIAGDILLRNSRFFRQSYYIGGNEKAAKLSGINVDKIIIINFVITALFAAFAGVVFASRMGSASAQAGSGLELKVITAVILGGASLQGGSGSVFGAFLGVFLMALIYNALTLLGVDIYWQQFVVGIVLISAVIIDTLGHSDKFKFRRIRQ